MLLYEIAAALLAIVAILSWRYTLAFAAVLLAVWLCLDKPVLALIIAAIAIPGVLITARAARIDAQRRAEDEQYDAWNAVRSQSQRERRIARLGMQ
jgi:hypothetical protein